MGHRSTTIAFIVVMVVLALIWVVYKDTGKKPDEPTEAGEAQTTEEARHDEISEPRVDTEADVAEETEQPVTETEPPRPVARPADGMSALAVRIVDRHGGVPGGLGVVLLPLGGGDDAIVEPIPSGTTRTRDVPPGTYLASILGAAAPAPGAARYVRVVQLRPNHVETLALTFGPRVLVSGTVRDFEGQPVAGAAVTVRPDVAARTTGMLPDWLVRTVNANTAGEFRIEQVPAGDLVIEVAGQGFALASHELRADFGDELIVNLVLADGLALSGTVTEPQGEPIAGASVCYLGGRDAPLTQTTTDKRGRYELRSVPHTGLGLFAFAEGHAYRTVPRDSLGDAAGSVPPIVLERESTIAGTVRYNDGTPAVGAVVGVEPVAEGDLLGYPAALETTSAADGRFTIRHLNDLPYRVVVTDAVSGQTVTQQLPARTRDADITIPVGRTLAGRITDEQTNAPVAGATVLAGAASATSGLDGTYEIRVGLDLAELDVAVSANGYEPKTEPKVALTGDTTTLDVTLVPVPVARCRLVDKANGEPVIGAPVRWRLADEPFARRSLRSSLEGEIAFYGARLSDEVHIEVLDRRFVPYIADVVLAELDGEEIVLSTGAIIRGRVLNVRGEPIARADVYVGEGYLEFADPFTKRVRSDAQGGYEMPGLPKGLFEITAVHPDYLTTQSVPVDTRRRDVTEGVDIVMDAGVTIAGLVLDERNDPIAGATVLGWGDFNYDVEQPGYKRSATTDAEGRFTVEKLRRTASGTIVLSASAPGYATATASTVVGPEEDSAEKDVVITLRGEAVLHGRAVTAEGVPIADVRVFVRVNDLVSREVRTGPDGAFVFDGLLPGRYTLVFTRPGFLYKELGVAVAAGPRPTQVEAVLERGAVLTGRVINAATGEPVALFGGRIATPDRLRSYRLHVTGTGQFTTDTLPDGDYVLMIHSKNMQAATVEGVIVRNHADPPEMVVRLNPAPR